MRQVIQQVKRDSAEWKRILNYAFAVQHRHSPRRSVNMWLRSLVQMFESMWVHHFHHLFMRILEMGDEGLTDIILSFWVRVNAWVFQDEGGRVWNG